MSESIKTGDMYLAALLMSYGNELVSIDRSNPKRQKFVFLYDTMKNVFVLDGQEVSVVSDMGYDEFVVEYVSRRVLFPPTYLDNLRRIRSLLIE